MLSALRNNWPEYAMEALGLGLFMLSACLFGTLLEHPGSPVRAWIADPLARRVLMGLAMGLTAVGLVYSPFGKRSGAHLNPAVTLTFLRLGKVRPVDALYYVGSQFLGAVAGVAAAALLLGTLPSVPTVRWVTTVPGPGGASWAFAAEVGISFLLMLAVLRAVSSRRFEPFAGLVAGSLVALYIVVEAPVSGMSMNPARTLGSALAARHFPALWIYFTAPLLGMLLAAQVHVLFSSRSSSRSLAHCAKLRHDPKKRCIFCGAPPLP